jgi:hypothetical protein
MSEDCPAIPPLALELILTGQAPPGPRMQSLVEHVQSCPRCAEKLAEGRAAGARWTGSAQAAALRARLSPARRPRRQWLLIAPLAAAAALLIWWRAPRPEGFQPKGQGLGLAVRHGGATTLWDGRPLARGDVVQLVWSAPRAGHLAVLAQAADGTVSVVHPEGRSEGASVPPGVDQPLGRSLTVESGLRLWTVFSPGPFPLAPLVAELRGRGALAGTPIVLEVGSAR